MNMFKSLVRLILVGLIYVIVGIIVASILRLVMPVQLAEECRHWNDHHVMEISLFMTGMIAYTLTGGIFASP